MEYIPMQDINDWQTKFESCKYAGRLIDKLVLLNTTATISVDILEVRKAIYYAKKYHADQKRKSGEPYYSHPIEVAYMVSDYLFKTGMIVASILHDVVEDTEMTAGMILDIFGHRVEKMVDMLTRNRPDGSKLSVEQILTNAYDKKDTEVILIKIVDRIHNLDTIKSFDENKQAETKKRTLIDFLPLVLDLEQYKFFDIILSLCIEEKEHPIFQDILTPQSTELNQSIIKSKDLSYYDS